MYPVRQVISECQAAAGRVGTVVIYLTRLNESDTSNSEATDALKSLVEAQVVEVVVLWRVVSLISVQGGPPLRPASARDFE